MDREKAKLAVFEGKKIRKTIYKNEWWFAIVDVVSALTDSVQPDGYIKDMRRRDPELSKGWGQIATPLAIETEGGAQKMNCANTEGIFRIIQSIPSPKAEPFKLWLAKVGYERIEEINDPERALNRSRDYWRRMGRSEKWIQQRMMGQEIRNKLTDYWKNNEVQRPDEYAILTDIIHREWSDLSVEEHKNLKKLKQENLRDHMTDAELVFTALAELSTRQIAETMDAKGLEENKIPAKKGGGVAKNARRELEQKTGKKVVSVRNFKIALGDKKLLEK